MKYVDSLAHNLNICTSAFLKAAIILWHAAKVIYVYFLFCHTEY